MMRKIYQKKLDRFRMCLYNSLTNKKEKTYQNTDEKIVLNKEDGPMK